AGTTPCRGNHAPAYPSVDLMRDNPPDRGVPAGWGRDGGMYMGLLGWGRIGLFAALVAAASGSAGPAAAQVNAAGDAELRALGRQMILNPGDLEIAFRYAELAAQRGEVDRAMATYERILLNDPNNARARDAVERLRLGIEPPRTVVYAKLGYE